jgi:HAD superfamily 5'-nucleotidase-like hydrolase
MAVTERADIYEPPPPPRRVFCNRTLNLRSIRAVGFDMDYTLIHYRIEEWERRAYEHARTRLVARGWPLDSVSFDFRMVTRGLIVDKQLGNVVKADRFGYVKRACHGTSMLSFEEQRHLYGSHVMVDLSDHRWDFLNTLFGLSASCLYAQCVDALDQGRAGVALGYADLYRLIGATVDEAHMMGHLKGEIIGDPDAFVDLDPDLPGALLDLKHAGKKLLLITNSDWPYTQAMMAYAFDRFLPAGTPCWRDLFDVVIVSARKPHFFLGKSPIFEVVDDSGLLRPVVGPLRGGGVYFGGDAATVEEHLGLSGSDLLYVGDHVFADVMMSKSHLRWRTALIVRELENELRAQEEFLPTQAELATLMRQKERLERGYDHLRLEALRHERRAAGSGDAVESSLRDQIQDLRAQLALLDERIGPLAQAASELGNARWGLLMRTGNDKSHMARQIERHADIYMSRVSNLGLISPFAYLRAPRSSLPHDGDLGGGGAG